MPPQVIVIHRKTGQVETFATLAEAVAAGYGVSIPVRFVVVDEPVIIIL